MTLEEAKSLLKDTVRHELRDHAFGDREVSWMKGDEQIAYGYFGSIAHVGFGHSSPGFADSDAYTLLECGTLEVERNDSTGPDTYTEGKGMAGLSLDGVWKEITKK